jgi:DNA-binding Xre family transcriptional regulator
MSALSLGEIIADNVQRLMDARGWSESMLAQETSLAKKTVNNLINVRHDIKISTIEAVARALKIQPWELLMRGAPITDRDALGNLVDRYSKSSAEGREMILKIAEREARYGKLIG